MKYGLLIGGLVLGAAAVTLAQSPWREFPAEEYNNFPAPPDFNVPAEYVFARLMYPPYGGRGFGRRGMVDWRQGSTSWTNDYPRADRHLLVAVRRLTRVNARSVEQAVNPDDGDDIYNWPMLYMVRAGFADFSQPQIDKISDYLARGGFLIGDDMWGTAEYNSFAATAERILPGKQLNEIPDGDPLWNVAFDLSVRYQISGQWSRFGRKYLNDGIVPHWRGIWDEKGNRLLISAWVNNDTGDSWEWADDPTYPEKYSALGIRMILNHIIYAMSH